MGNFKIGYYPTYHEEEEEEESRHRPRPWQSRQARDIYNGIGVPSLSSIPSHDLEAATAVVVSQNRSQDTTCHPSDFLLGRLAPFPSPAHNKDTASASALHSSNSCSSSANLQQPPSIEAGQIMGMNQMTTGGPRGESSLEVTPRLSPTSAAGTGENRQCLGTLTTSNSSVTLSESRLHANPSRPTLDLIPMPRNAVSNSYVATNVRWGECNSGHTSRYPSFNYGYGGLSPVATREHASSARDPPSVVSDGQIFLQEMPTLTQLNSGDEPKTILLLAPSAPDDGPMEDDMPLVENRTDTPPQDDPFWSYMEEITGALPVGNIDISEQWSEHIETGGDSNWAKDEADIDSYSMLNTPSASSSKTIIPWNIDELLEQDSNSIIDEGTRSPLATTAEDQPIDKAHPALGQLLRMRLDDGDLPAGVEAMQDLINDLSPLPDELRYDNPEIAGALEEFKETQRRLENDFMRGTIQNLMRLKQKFERHS